MGSKLTKAQQAERDQAIKDLRKILRPGMRVRTILRHVSASGMQREISLAIGTRDKDIRSIDYLAAIATGHRIGKHGGLVVGGCGMDMGFHLVYILGATLWPKGTAKPHGRRNGQPDSDGGYALKHDWI